MTIRITKVVPLGPALLASGEVLDRTKGRPEEGLDAEFFQWFSNTPVPGQPSRHGREGVIHHPWLPIEAVQALLPTVPATPAGIAWSAAAAAALERTIADGYRGYDDILVDTPFTADASHILYGLTQRLTEEIPLLERVAGEIDMQDIHNVSHRFGEIPRLRARVDPERGVALNGNDESEDSSDYQPITQWATWEQIEALAPGTKETVFGAISLLDEAIPPMATTPDPRRGA